MGLALRVLAFLVFVAAVGGATFGAYQVFEPESTFTSVELTPPQGTPIGLPVGGAREVAIGAENLGDTAVEVTLASTTPGVRFEQEGPLPVAAGQTRQVRGQLSVGDGFDLGEHAVRLQATQQGSDKALASVSFTVNVFEPVAPQVTLEPMVPAVVPGGSATFLATIENPAPTAQQVTLALVGAEGVLTPQRVTVQPSGTARAKVVANVPADASGAFTPTLRATSGGEAGTGEADARLPVLAPGEAAAAALFEAVEVVPGTPFTVPLVVVSNLGEAREVTIEGEGLSSSSFAEAPAAGAVGGFAAFTAPDTIPASGSPLTLAVRVGDAAVDVPVQLLSASGGKVAEAGTNAQVNYIGRLTSGEVFDSSLIGVVLGPYPKASFFQERLELRPLTVQLDPSRPNVIEGFFNAVLGLREGQATTASIPPEQAYGGERLHDNVSATTAVPRESESERFLRGFQFFELPPEFDIENQEVGDVITYEPELGGVRLTLRFRVVEKTDTTVDLERVEEVGDQVTLYPSFPNMTEVVEITDTAILFRTTPADDLQEPFTWISGQGGGHQQGWGEVTTIAEVNETSIVLRHDPEVGTTYQTQTPQGPVTYTVEGVTDEAVQVSRPNPSPLAAQTLVFDIFVVGVADAAQGGSPITIGGPG